MATNYSSWLDYKPYTPKAIQTGNLPGWLFNNDWQSFEDIGRKQDQAEEEQQKVEAQSMALEQAKRKQSASDEAQQLLKDNPELLNPDHIGDLDSQLTGVFAKSGDMENALKFVDRQAARSDAKTKAQDAATEKKNKRELREVQGGLALVGSDNSIDWLVKPKPDKPDKESKGTAESFFAPDGTPYFEVIRDPARKVQLLQQGYQEAAKNPLDQEDQLRNIRKGQTAGTAPAGGGASLYDAASNLWGRSQKELGGAIGSYQPRNSGRGRLIAVPRGTGQRLP